MSKYCSARLLSFSLFALCFPVCRSLAEGAPFDPKKPGVPPPGSAFTIDHSNMTIISTQLSNAIRSGVNSFGPAHINALKAQFGPSSPFKGQLVIIDDLAKPETVHQLALQIEAKKPLAEVLLGPAGRGDNANIINEARNLLGISAQSSLDELIILAYREDDKGFDALKELRIEVANHTGIDLDDLFAMRPTLSVIGEQSITLQSISGDGPTVWGGEATFSTRFGPTNMPIDISLNRIEAGSTAQGTGGTLRLGVSDIGSRETAAFIIFRNSVLRANKTTRYRSILTALLSSYFYMHSFIHTVHRPFVSASFRYQHINGDSNIVTLGLDMSQLITNHDYKPVAQAPWGTLYRFTVQGVSRTGYANAELPNSTTLRVGFGWYRQDKSPYLKQINGNEVEMRPGKWTRQYGLSIFPQSSVDSDTTISATYRFRRAQREEPIRKRGPNDGEGSIVTLPNTHLPVGTVGIGGGLRLKKIFVLGSVTMPF